MHAVDYGRSQVYRLPIDDLRHGISDPLIISSTVAYAAPAPLIPLFPRHGKRDETIPVDARGLKVLENWFLPPLINVHHFPERLFRTLSKFR